LTSFLGFRAGDTTIPGSGGVCEISGTACARGGATFGCGPDGVAAVGHCRLLVRRSRTQAPSSRKCGAAGMAPKGTMRAAVADGALQHLSGLSASARPFRQINTAGTSTSLSSIQHRQPVVMVQNSLIASYTPLEGPAPPVQAVFVPRLPSHAKAAWPEGEALKG
jgi:hypothetical protein